MTQEGQLPPPLVKWAQRRNILFVTICLEDCKDVVLEIQPESLYFKSLGGTEKKLHEVKINFYKEIQPSNVIKNPSGRIFELVLLKKEEGPYWPRLMKEKTKVHWLKSDFNKWKDEDDSEDDKDQDQDTRSYTFEEMMRQMGGLGESEDRKPNFDYIGDEVDEVDSDDEELPDLE